MPGSQSCDPCCNVPLGDETILRAQPLARKVHHEWFDEDSPSGFTLSRRALRGMLRATAGARAQTAAPVEARRRVWDGAGADGRAGPRDPLLPGARPESHRRQKSADFAEEDFCRRDTRAWRGRMVRPCGRPILGGTVIQRGKGHRPKVTARNVADAGFPRREEFVALSGTCPPGRCGAGTRNMMASPNARSRS